MKAAVTAFASIFVVRLAFELLGRWSDNSYLDYEAISASISAGLLTIVGACLARRIVRDGDNNALAASVLAVMLATYVGALDLENRQRPEKDESEKPAISKPLSVSNLKESS